MASSFRANSSDWVTALLERPADGAPEGAKPLSWLPDSGVPEGGFVEGSPFEKPDPEPEPETEPETEPEVETGDVLEEILRKALAETKGIDEAEAPEPDAPPEPEPEPEPEPDPIAEAFARGEAAGRQAANVEQQALTEQKIILRQTFRALDQVAMDALANDLSQTVITLCSASLADYIPAPDALQRRCLEAAQRLGSGAVGATLYLHPDDLTLIDQQGLEGWKIVGDPMAERGGLRLEGQDGSISDRPTDWRRSIASAIRG